MTTKMKGLFKGLRYISQIFEEEKEQDIQIGFPTDVKHVAHIGWDGPSVNESPSWMKEFTSPTGTNSAPLGPPGDHRGDPEIKWVSEDSRRGSRVTDSPGRDSSEVPRSSRRHNSGDESPKKKESSTKSKQTRRNHSKESSEGSVRSSRQQPQESSQGTDRSLPDIPKKSRRKKSKESVNGGGSSRPRSKAGASNGNDNGPDNESGSQHGHTPDDDE